MSERQNYIGGEWVDAESGDTFEVHNPAHTDEVVATFPQGGEEDAERAVEAAAAAADDWADVPGPERGKILRDAAGRLADQKRDLTQTLVSEEGKTGPEAGGEVQRAVDIFYYYAEKARDLGGTVKQSSSGEENLYTVREPLGVAALITPWNYPIAIPSWKLGPALATGNTVVLKPASQAPTVASMVVEALAEALEDADAPDGVLNFVTGPGSEVGDTFMRHEDVDAVSFTGSAEVGNMVYDVATEDQKRVQCEMGGKNPTLVTANADLDRATSVVGYGAFGVTGQACTAASRAVVHTDVHDEFVDAIVDWAEGIAVGDGLEDAQMGPQVSESEFQGTLDYIEVGKEEGATLAAGGGRLEGDEYEDGWFVEPTVFTDVDPDMRIAQEEIFGPVLSVIEVDSFEEGLAVANDVKYGLSASVVTEDHGEANRFVRDAEAGVVKVNDMTTGLELHVPFGGFKESSTNTYREQGDAGLDFYTSIKTVYDNF